MPNARLSERAPFIAEVDVVAAGLASPRRVWGSDVSESGMFLQTTQPFRVGDRVSLRFDVEKSEVHIRAAEVMWVRPFEPIAVDGRMPGVGLKFVAVDPPARAALRRFVAPQLADTQSERETSLPPPSTSLPPVTESILQKTGALRISDDIAVSLPPFSQPPLNISLLADEPSELPEEVRVFRQSKPMPVTIGPRRSTEKASRPPSFLVGWQFRLDEGFLDELLPSSLPPQSLPPTAEAAPAPAAPTTWSTSTSEPPEMPKLDLRFDDAGPQRPSLTPEERSVWDVTSSPPEGVLRDDEQPLHELFSALPSSDAETLDRDVEQGRIALRHLPIVPERRTSSRAPKQGNRALPTAIALLCAGTVAGAGIGIVGKHLEGRHRHATSASAAVPRAHAAPLTATLAPTPTLTPTPALMPATPKSVVDAERDLPESARMRAPDPLGDTLADAGAPLPRSSTTAPKGVRSTSVRVGSAEVVKAFALTSPSRVVVDLAGGKVPKGSLEPGGGIARVRFGHPTPGTSRVVIELDGDKRARDLTTVVKDGVLTISFR